MPFIQNCLLHKVCLLSFIMNSITVCHMLVRFKEITVSDHNMHWFSTTSGMESLSLLFSVSTYCKQFSQTFTLVLQVQQTILNYDSLHYINKNTSVFIRFGTMRVTVRANCNGSRATCVTSCEPRITSSMAACEPLWFEPCFQSGHVKRAPLPQSFQTAPPEFHKGMLFSVG